ncbi:MAG: hypothetical protein NTV32_03755 [Gammaproteobacteria bacterium]|nr:hypothetical protein [Gammaproteobacteria bacterium]
MISNLNEIETLQDQHYHYRFQRNMGLCATTILGAITTGLVASGTSPLLFILPGCFALWSTYNIHGEHKTTRDLKALGALPDDDAAKRKFALVYSQILEEHRGDIRVTIGNSIPVPF